MWFTQKLPQCNSWSSQRFRKWLALFPNKINFSSNRQPSMQGNYGLGDIQAGNGSLRIKCRLLFWLKRKKKDKIWGKRENAYLLHHMNVSNQSANFIINRFQQILNACWENALKTWDEYKGGRWRSAPPNLKKKTL